MNVAFGAQTLNTAVAGSELGWTVGKFLTFLCLSVLICEWG